MPTKTPQPYLPSELLLQIIDCLIPRTTPKPIALPSTHLITKTILSLTRTSRIAYPAALRHLYANCLYIDSPHRLHKLADTLSSPSTNNSPPPRTLPHIPLLNYTTSLYLATADSYTIEDHVTVHTTIKLLSLLASSLRRLVIDLPLRSLDDDVLISHLQVAFLKLTQLETFNSVRDELPFQFHWYPDEDRVWSLWRQLRVLALYNPDISVGDFWKYAGDLEHLQTLILTRSDGLDEVDIKECWRRNCQPKIRGVDIILVNVEEEHSRRETMGKANWKEDDIVVVRELNVPTSYYGDEDAPFLCQEWVKRRMLRGEETLEE